MVYHSPSWNRSSFAQSYDCADHQLLDAQDWKKIFPVDSFSLRNLYKSRAHSYLYCEYPSACQYSNHLWPAKPTSSVWSISREIQHKIGNNKEHTATYMYKLHAITIVTTWVTLGVWSIIKVSCKIISWKCQASGFLFITDRVLTSHFLNSCPNVTDAYTGMWNDTQQQKKMCTMHARMHHFWFHRKCCGHRRPI